jgi:hypothetical protein
VLTTDQKGAIAESAIVHAATKLGIDVYKPLAGGTRCDLVFDIPGRQLLRIQCKWASRDDGVIAVRTYSSRRSSRGFLKRSYTASEVDAIAAYCAATDRCYFLPLDRFNGRTQIQLRLAPTRNNQAAGINWASDFEFEATLGGRTLGAIAQLGERLHGMQEVAGSSPAGSITKAVRQN